MSTPEQTGSLPPLRTTAVAFAVAAAIVAATLGLLATVGPTETNPALAQQLERREPGDPQALGDVDAPVVMTMWTDFTCMFCAQFAQQIEPEIVERFVDTGLVRLEVRHLPGPNDAAFAAASISVALAEQDLFWDYYQLLYTTDTDVFDWDDAFDVAERVGGDIDQIIDVLDDAEATVNSDWQLAVDLGLVATPAFVIGGYPVVGALPASQFEQVIMQAAADAGAVPDDYVS